MSNGFGGTHFVLLQQIIPFLDDLGQRQRHVEFALDHTGGNKIERNRIVNYFGSVSRVLKLYAFRFSSLLLSK